jgi:L-seryl-tRNA(Ser) seleniumtransferase
LLQPSLRHVINATGVILHTNLGRAPLARAAIEAVAEVAAGYCNLEYDLSAGERGRRESHCQSLLARLTGGEDAIVTNNGAAAVLLVLDTFAEGGEVIVSRGELIEIGGSFRIPDVMHKSGARLREVGTTNRTRISDYENAINDNTRLLLRVHPSNYRIIGFSEVVSASLAAGLSLVTFSGDKLLGGAQAGIIVGKREMLARLRKNPLMRALRVDKMTYAALEATLRLYERGAATREVPGRERQISKRGSKRRSLRRAQQQTDAPTLLIRLWKSL